MEISNQEIDDIAEKIIKKYSKQFPVDPIEIAQSVGIEIIEGSRDYPFKGLIRRQDGIFYIILNMHILENVNYSMCRYTISHELGHYFIRHHRNKLKKGESIAFTGKDSANPKKKMLEDQAQQFAASLLMPKSQFIKYFTQIEETGFLSIIRLKEHFNVSITSATIRFTHLNLEPAISILWKDSEIINKGISDSFREILNLDDVKIKLNLDRPKFEEEEVSNSKTGIRFYTSITPLSSWVHNVDKNWSNSFFVIEETFYCKHWNLTLLRPMNISK
ncbi:ImmA/IrrE family metallo-endopeptidase [Reichenbachiella sp. MALMAid0571]|uniref:ImmA/IrrE family metallo-endopeptidase n=1 Tax=Reichenbachiella sp. MALMAid0571 TaxID=3143939 RepID=UPI0032DF5675